MIVIYCSTYGLRIFSEGTANKKRVYNTRCTPSHLYKATLSDAVE